MAALAKIAKVLVVYAVDDFILDFVAIKLGSLANVGSVEVLYMAV